LVSRATSKTDGRKDLFGSPADRLFNGQERPSAAGSLERQTIAGDGAEEHHNEAAKEDCQDDSHGQDCTIAIVGGVIDIVDICAHGKSEGLPFLKKPPHSTFVHAARK
jgi:hypothetical protein